MKDLLTTEQAALILSEQLGEDITPKNIARLCATGSIAAGKNSGIWIMGKDSLEDFLKNRAAAYLEKRKKGLLSIA